MGMTMRDSITLSYVICTTVRSGSWMLSSALARLGTAGRPAEYFGQTLWEALTNNRAELKLDSIEGFMDGVMRASTTPNGVFGTKLPANHTAMFVRRASESARREYRSLREALESEFPHLRYVYLAREDKVAQAVSLYRAIMTGQWRGSPGPAARERLAALPYDQYALERCYEDIDASRRYWEGFFKTHGITPVRVSYEDLVEEYEPAMRRLLQELGLPWHQPISEPETVRQADERSAEWIRRFTSRGRFPIETHMPPEHIWAPY